MQEYDDAFKLLFRRAAPRAIQLLSGTSIVQWLDVELPKTQNLRMDLLGEDANGKLHQKPDSQKSSCTLRPAARIERSSKSWSKSLRGAPLWLRRFGAN